MMCSSSSPIQAQAALELFPQFFHVEKAVTGQIGDQFKAVSAEIFGQNQGLLHLVILQQASFDLRRLNPVPPDLDLFVDPAQIFDGSIGPPPAQVSGMRALAGSNG
jgi:hypothetical protein